MFDSFILNRPFQIFSYAGKYPKYSTEALRNKSDRHTKRVVHRSASYAEELYEFSQVNNNSRLPSKTLKFPEVPSISISVHDPRSADSKKFLDLDTLSIT